MEEAARPSPETLYYFVDEAGDPTLFSDSGEPLLQNEGCSSYFILGKLDVDDPETLSNELNVLRADLLKNPYFKGVPSMQLERRKTAIAFHAKDDLGEVRWEVFKLLKNQRVRFHAVVRDKAELLAHVRLEREKEPKYRYNPNEVYDFLTKELFKGGWFKADRFEICYAERGNKDRTTAFEEAVKLAIREYETGFGIPNRATYEIRCSTPPKSAGLQAVDYFLWALQRFYERREDRFLELMWDQITEVHDLDYFEKKGKRKGAFYRKEKPLTLETRKK